MPSSHQHAITIQTPTATTHFWVVHTDHIPFGTLLLTLHDDGSEICFDEVYPATYATDTGRIDGKFTVQDRLEHGERSVIIGMFHRLLA